MPYTFEVAFSGILGFVPHPDGRGAAVVLPDAMNGKLTGPGTGPSGRPARSSVDGGPLARHFGLLRIPGRHLGRSPRSELVRYLDGERVRFEIDRPEAGVIDVALERTIRMAEVCEEDHDVDPAALEAVPREGVLAHVALEGGRLETSRAAGAWIIPDALCSQPLAGPFAYEVVWRAGGARGPVTVSIEPFGGGDTERLTLDPAAGDARIHVSNLCDANPLRWEVDGYHPRDDPDFRWHFELLSDAAKEAVRRRLAGASLPYPVPADSVGFAALSQGGSNCMSVAWEPAAYEL